MKRKVWRVLLGVVLFGSPDFLYGATYMVTNAADTVTPGTLRWAILSANADPHPDTIAFNLNVPYTIGPTGALPYVTNHNTFILGSNFPPRVILQGAQAGEAAGLRLSYVTNCTVAGLIIRNFEWDGIYLLGASNCTVKGNVIIGNADRGVSVVGLDNTIGGTNASDANVISSNAFYNVQISGVFSYRNRVSGNFIGTDATGSNRWVGGMGVHISGACQTTIGGTRPGDRNIIGTQGDGIWIQGSLSSWMDGSGNVVQGNYIGVDASGRRAFGGGTYGILIDEARGNDIGGAMTQYANVIAGYSEGIGIVGTNADQNTVRGNLIGVAADGTTVLSNTMCGIDIIRGSLNWIGGAYSGQRNVIGGSQYGIYVRRSNTVGNVIRGNYIGVATNGFTPIPNSAYNIWIYDAPDTIIGGTNAGDGNLLSGCLGSGIFLQEAGSSNTVIQGNLIGTDATGLFAVSNRAVGIGIQSANNLVGGSSPEARNVMAGNGGDGISLSTSQARNNRIVGNFLGVDATGSNALPNQRGLSIFSAVDNQIGGFAPGERNVISGNREQGVYVYGPAWGNVIEHNLIGTDLSATLNLSNGLEGVYFGSTSYSNRLGGVETPNYIVFSGGDGVYMLRTTGTVVRGNFIGNNGDTPQPNRGIGVYVDSSERVEISENVISGNQGDGVYMTLSPDAMFYTNLIGLSRNNLVMSNAASGIRCYTSPGGRLVGNAISGNGDYGFYSLRCDRTVFLGNYIGVDTNGTAARGNAGSGLFLTRGASNEVGRGGSKQLANVISGNGSDGLTLYNWEEGGYHIVKNNRIGTDIDGRLAIPNAGIGLVVSSSPGNQLGGHVAGEGNIVSGNNDAGVQMAGIKSCRNSLYGNTVGADSTGTNALGNGSFGVILESGSASNVVGATGSGYGNRIAYNDGAGVLVGSSGSDDATVRNWISGNSISRNAGLGIDLADNGVTPNDTLDPDTGPNRLQNFPALVLASNNGTTIRIEGYLDSLPSETFLLEFYGSAQVDPSGYGEGEVSMGGAYLTLPAGGVAGFTNSFTAPNPPPSFLTATATLVDGLEGETSEFSRRFILDADGDGMPDGYEFRYAGSITGLDPAGDPDGDRSLNLAEFLADTLPDDPVDYTSIVELAGTGGVVQVTAAPHSEYRNYSLMATYGLLPTPLVWTPQAATLERQGSVYILRAPVSAFATTLVYGVSAEVP